MGKYTIIYIYIYIYIYVTKKITTTKWLTFSMILQRKFYLHTKNSHPLLTEWSHATEPFPYSTKTWEAPRCQTKTYSPFFLQQRQTKGKLLLQKLNTGQASENNNNHIVSSLAYYSIWIINLYFKVIRVLFLFCLGNYLRGTRTTLKTFYTSDTSRNTPDKTTKFQIFGSVNDFDKTTLKEQGI